jgi:hypothetical protein
VEDYNKYVYVCYYDGKIRFLQARLIPRLNGDYLQVFTDDIWITASKNITDHKREGVLKKLIKQNRKTYVKRFTSL